MDGQGHQYADEVAALSKLPSKEGLLSMLLSVLRADPWPGSWRQRRGRPVPLSSAVAAEGATAAAEAAPAEAFRSVLSPHF